MRACVSLLRGVPVHCGKASHPKRLPRTFFFPFLMRLIGEAIKPMPSGFKRKARVHSCVRKMRVVATAVGSGIFFLSLFFFFAFVSSAESRECSFSSRQRDEPNQPRLSIMQGATPSPPLPSRPQYNLLL